MFWWAHRYRPVVSPNFDQLGSPTYYGLVLVQQLALFSVPAFLFISGFFIAYAAHGDARGLSWKVVRARISNLLWPYLIWSIVIFIGNGLLGKVFSPAEYTRQLLTGAATGAFFFIPLLCQLYLLAPLIGWLGKDHPIILLSLAAAIQLLASGLFYLQLGRVHLSNTVLRSDWLFVWQAFYFPLGVVVGFRSPSIQRTISRFRWVLVVMSIILGVVSVLESEWLYQVTENFEWAHSLVKISSSLYAVVFILAFLAFKTTKGRFSQVVDWIGMRSYGIYLLHPELLALIARIVYHTAAWLLSQQLLLMLILVISGMVITLLVMEGIARSPIRGIYHYLFG